MRLRDRMPVQSTTAARERLAEQQAVLVRAVTLGERVPPGFDPRRIRALAVSLLRKRAAAVARVWPAIPKSLGADYMREFEQFAARQPLLEHGGALTDGLVFLRGLSQRSGLNDRLRQQLLAAELEYRLTTQGIRRRRGLAVRCAWLAESQRLLIGLRVGSWSRTFRWSPIPWRR